MKFFILFCFILMNTGCSPARDQAEKNSVVAPDLGLYEFSERKVLTNNKLFMWHENVNAQEAERVIRAGAELDDYEEQSVQIKAQAASDPEEREWYNQEHEEQLFNIEAETETRINTIIENSDFYMNQPSQLALFRDGGAYGVTLYSWEFQTYSSAVSEDRQQRVYDVTYEETGGTWRFKVRGGPRLFGIDADDYEFRVSRTKLSIQDGRVFYQGDITAHKNGRVIRRGQAKFYAG